MSTFSPDGYAFFCCTTTDKELQEWDSQSIGIIKMASLMLEMNYKEKGTS